MISSSPGKARSRAGRFVRSSSTPTLAAAAAAAVAVLACFAAPARAAAGVMPAPASFPLAEPGGWHGWSLPPNYAPHGVKMDQLYWWIFWITMITFVAVWAVMIVFIVKYRSRPERRKALFTHGNTKLEMIWTLVPAVILLLLALVTKKVWDDYRYSPTAHDPNTARILVVGEQFNWNVVYPGADNKLGRYMIFPKTTDPAWPASDPNDPYEFPKEYPGPAFMKESEARAILNGYLEKNRLGKDFTDPDGADDIWKDSLGHPVFVPKDRPVEIHLSSKDVIHDFFLPNYRVKLDAVPGMRGHIYFTAQPPMSSTAAETKSIQKINLNDLEKLVVRVHPEEWALLVPEGAALPEGVKVSQNKNTPPPPGQIYDTSRRLFTETEVPDPRRAGRTKKVQETLAREGAVLDAKMIAELKKAGFTEVTAYRPKYWDLVCEELCGAGHTAMRGSVIVLEDADYRKRFQPTPEPATPPSTDTPAASASGTGNAAVTATITAPQQPAAAAQQ